MVTPKRILIVNVNWLGDVLFSTAAIRTIRYAFPESFIACVIPPRCLPVLEGNTHLDEVIVFDEQKTHKGLMGKLRFLRYLRRKRFDAAYLLHRSFSRTLLVALAGIRERIGYVTAKRQWLLTKKIIPPDIRRVHRIDYYLGVVAGAGIEVKDRFTEFFVRDEDIRAVEAFLSGHGIREDDALIGINPGGNWGPKRWPKENFAALAARLEAAGAGRVIVTGGPNDTGLAEYIASGMKSAPVNACGKLTLKQFGVLAHILNIFITADSGPLHIANAVGCRRIIALFGPTDPAITGPYPSDTTVIIQKTTGCAVPCYTVDCKDNRCMKAITVDDVMDAVNNHPR